MMFYELCAPEYETDQEDLKRNPIKVISKYFIPSIDCNICGKWASSDRIRVDMNYNQLKLFRGIKFLNNQDWFEDRKKWANILGLSASEISPGAEIGMPEIEIKSENFEDFLHPMPGNIFVTSKVVDILKSAGATGVDYIPAKINISKGIKVKSINSLKLWELKITGSGWRFGVNLEGIIACERCKRKIFPNLKMEIDVSRWDTSDFFNIDCNPNIIIISSKIHNALKKEKLSNYQLKELAAKE